MTDNFIRKVIRASAGTGKTYRLSLEYIGLLIKYRQYHVHFNEILVITFTNKATAEIRDRVFGFLQQLTTNGEQAAEIRDNLKKALNIELHGPDLDYLRAIYREMLVNKNQVQISTIDSFINRVFKTIIAPYLGLSHYDVDPNINEKYLNDIYDYLLNENNLPKIRPLLGRRLKKNLQGYEAFIKSMFSQRWVFHFIESFCSNNQERPSEEIIKGYFERFTELWFAAIEKFDKYLLDTGTALTCNEMLKKDFYEIIAPGHRRIERDKLVSHVREKLADPNTLEDHYDYLLKAEPFWNGSRLLRKQAHKPIADDLKEKISAAAQALAEYYFYQALLREQDELIALSKVMLEKYDEIKYREKIFTYDDIAYYTFRHLYDPDLSLIDQDTVTNAFYEILAAQIRFVMIDEFQDTSILQFKILLPIIKEVIAGAGLKEYGGVIIVGDEKQSIYGWRGGERDLMLQISTLLQIPKPVRLDTTFRSKPLLTEFVNNFFSASHLHDRLKSYNIEWPYEVIRTAKKDTAGYLRFKFRNYSTKTTSEDGRLQKQEIYQDFFESEILPLIRDRRILLAKSAIIARQNSDLESIGAVLDDMCVDYILESSSSIFQHRAIKPLLYLLRFIVYQDAHELLKFLRSDLVLLDGSDFKKVLLRIRDLQPNNSGAQLMRTVAEKLPRMPVLRKIANMVVQAASTDLFNFCKLVLQTFHVSRIFNLENDVKNINFFLETVSDFIINNREYDKTAAGLLAFIAENENRESLKQVGLEEKEAISLLTIHKSKGMEFDNVFVFWDLSPRSHGTREQLNSYLHYSENLTEIDEYVLTFNYDTVLPASHKRHLKEHTNRKEFIEDLNSFYVAITRAKTNLCVYFAYSKSGGFDKMLADASDTKEPNIHQIIFPNLVALLENQGTLIKSNENEAVAAYGATERSVVEEKIAESFDFSMFRDYWDVNRDQYLIAREPAVEGETYLDFKSMFTKKRNTDIGNIVHFYLSFIIKATPEEFDYAYKRTIGFFGSLLPTADIKKIIDRVNDFLVAHPGLFSPEKWDQVFTEYTLFSPSGHEMRIDRLLVDKRNKSVLIVDFKTGEIYDSRQMKMYVETVLGLPVVREQGYRVEGRLVEIDLD